VRKPAQTSWLSRFVKKVPYFGKLYDAYKSHQLDNFVGGGFLGSGTHREDWLKRNGLEPGKRYSIAQLSKKSGVPKEILQEVYNRGIGAYRTSGKSVRLKNSFVKNVDAPMSKKLSKEQWAWARLYSFLDGNPKHDNDLRANKEKIGGGEAYETSAAYLKEAKRRAKAHGYDPTKLEFAKDGTHKLQLTTPEGKTVKFGRAGYGDHLIWRHREMLGQAPEGTAEKKRQTFHKSHLAMKGKWKDDKYSPNWLAIRVLW
jgi:hypothetical protein